MKNTVDDFVKKAINDRLKMVSDYEHFTAQRIRELCESPIEERLAIALWHTDFPLYYCGEARPVFRGPHDYDTPEEYLQKERAKEFVYIHCQQPLHDYRVDFLLYARMGSHPDFYRIVIECDGHDFHERTKEQATRDKKRDRALSAKGYMIFRFTGSEIYRDAFACAKEVATYLETEFWKRENAENEGGAR